MKILKIIFLSIVALTIILLLGIANYGGFTKITFSESKTGGEKMVYLHHKGGYDEAGEIIQKMAYQLENEGIKSTKGFGIYYDNPRFVKKIDLRSDIGCIIENTDTIKIYKLHSSYLIKTSEVKNYLITEFPYKGSISLLFGVLRVYPAMTKYIRDNGYSEKGPVIEIYDRSRHKISFRKELIKKGR